MIFQVGNWLFKSMHGNLILAVTNTNVKMQGWWKPLSLDWVKSLISFCPAAGTQHLAESEAHKYCPHLVFVVVRVYCNMASVKRMTAEWKTQFTFLNPSLVLVLDASWKQSCDRSEKSWPVPAVVQHLLPKLISTEGWSSTVRLMSLLWIMAHSSHAEYELTTAYDRVQTKRKNLQWRDFTRSSQAVKNTVHVCIGQSQSGLVPITYCWGLSWVKSAKQRTLFGQKIPNALNQLEAETIIWVNFVEKPF